MPEGHTIHRLAQDLERDLANHPVVATSPQGRFSATAALLDGARFGGADAYGKNLFLSFEGDDVVLVHLGLIGKFRRHELGLPERDTIRFRLAGPSHGWDLTGPQTCRLLEPGERKQILAKLGPDPLRRGAKPDGFVDKAQRSGKPIGALLLDQGALAGIGNVFRAEFCFLAGINPHTPAKTLPEQSVLDLWSLAKTHLRTGVKLNRIVTRDPDEVGATRAKMVDDDRLYTYKRDGLPCHRCGTDIVLTEIAARKTWYCPSCQPLP